MAYKFDSALKKYQKAWYKRNRSRLLLKQRRINSKLRKQKRDFIRQQKSKPCMDCKRRFHFSAMDFDHVRGRKQFSLGRTSLQSWDQLKAEILKCEVVCANCHRLRTFRRGCGEMAERLSQKQ